MKNFIFVLMLLIMVGGASGLLTDGLVAHWSMEEASVPILDSSINGIDLANASGTPLYQQTGKIGYSLYTDLSLIHI